MSSTRRRARHLEVPVADLPPTPPVPPTGRARVVDEEGRATPEFAAWLAKLVFYLGHITPLAGEPPLPTRSTQTLADWLRAQHPTP